MSTKICPSCKTEFKFLSYLVRHLTRNVHCTNSSNDIDAIISDIKKTTIKTKFICTHCNSNFTQNSSLKTHLVKSKCAQTRLRENNINNNNTNTINNITNNNLTNSNNTTNIINNINIQNINPFGLEDVRAIPINEMKKILISGDNAGLHIIKSLYDKIENKNFYKPNLSRPEIAFLNQELKLTIYKSKEFCDALFDRCITLLHHMLYLCKSEFTNMNIKFIYENIEHIETTMRTEIYDKKLKNIIESEFRNNNIDTKDRIKNFIKKSKEDTVVKDTSLLQIKNTLELNDKQNEEYTISIKTAELNKLFGDPQLILGLRKDELVLNLRISRFEESIFYNFWIDRLKTIKKYINTNKISRIGDIINIRKEELKIMEMLDIIKRRVELNRGEAYIDLNINAEFRLTDVVS